ncbi:MAG TPA: hypothetical protein VMW32_05405 [Bacteroidales bacterium]|nr:hypothetical protein [Bacteroidales bacterium]
MRKSIIIILLLSLIHTGANAQLWKLRRYEVSAGLCTTQFFGDIGGFSRGENILGLKDFSFRHTSLSINTSFKYRILDDVSARLNLTFGYFHTTDERGSNVEREFESRTFFFEPSLTGEYYIIKNKGESSFLVTKGVGNPSLSFFSLIDFYVFAGIGGLSYHVKPNDNLAPFVTKPDGFTAVIPVGLGADFNYSGIFNFGVELGGRYAFSDNIDGYSSIYSKSNDIYYFLNFKFTYKIKTGKNGLPSFLK